MKSSPAHKHILPQRFQPFVTVAVVVESQGKFLLVEEIPRDLERVTFNQPAGHLEPQETIIAGAERELFEETGLSLPINELIGVYQYFLPDKQFIRFTFKASLPCPVAISPQDPQIIAGHWLTLAEIKNLSNLRSPLVIKCIDDYINNGTSNASSILSQ